MNIANNYFHKIYVKNTANFLSMYAPKVRVVDKWRVLTRGTEEPAPTPLKNGKNEYTHNIYPERKFYCGVGYDICFEV